MKTFIQIILLYIVFSAAAVTVQAAEKAFLPYPADGGHYLSFDGEYMPLTWKGSLGASEFDVYVGQSPAAISRANRESGEFLGTVTDPSTENPFQPETNKTYYWRVDQIIYGEAVKGSIWKFTASEWSTGEYLRRGDEALTLITETFGMNSGGFWEDSSKSQPAFAWPMAVGLLMRNRAAETNEEYIDSVLSTAAFINKYRSTANGIAGFDCVPEPGQTNRFYDDNSWLSWALSEAYIITGDESLLTRSKEAYDFTLSGEDDTYGGGIWWKETQYPGDPKPCKAVSATGGGALAGALLYKITGEEKYKNDCERLLSFLQNVLREGDGDGQILNDYSEDGVGHWYWSYNTAVPAAAYAVLYEVTGDKAYLNEAVELAEVLIGYYYDTEKGAIKDEAYFAFTIVECLSRLYNATNDNRYLSIISRTLDAVYNGRYEGFYNKMWDGGTEEGAGESDEKSLLINAPAARAFYTVALLKPSVTGGMDSEDSGGGETGETGAKPPLILILSLPILTLAVLLFAKKILTRVTK